MRKSLSLEDKVSIRVVIPEENVTNKVAIFFLKWGVKSLDFFYVNPYYREASFAQFVHKQ